MDPSGYKDFKTSRGYNYHYFYAAPEGDKPVLLLLHGFPTMSLDWMNVVSFFKKQGYGFVVPDLLGYMGTDKPTDPKEYRFKLMADDIMEILESENVKKVISIAHDFGSILNGRIANYYQNRFEAFGFLAIALAPPAPDGVDVDAINDLSEKLIGYRYLGYMKFFVKEDTAQIIANHYESLQCVAYAKDHNALRENFCPDGKLYEWLTNDRKAEIADYVSQEALELGTEMFKKFGFKAPLCWYKSLLGEHNRKDDAEIPKEDYIIRKPVFFGATLQDGTGPPEIMKATMATYAPNLKVVDFDTGHWILMQTPDKVNEELQKWLQSL